MSVNNQFSTYHRCRIYNFRLTSNREEGWLKIKLGEEGVWEDMYVTFDYFVISYSITKPDHNEEVDKGIDDDDSTKVQMDKVISLRTDVRF